MKKLLLMMVVLLTTTVLFAQNNYQDVVYLKNGSIVRGTIIEQIPNESLKIETADGNLFVYKISDVEKMTKERVGAPAKSTPPSESESVRHSLQATRQMLQNSSQNVQNAQNVNQQSVPDQQFPYEKRVTQFGIKGGLNLASETGDQGESTTQRTGIHIGFFLETPISNKVGFQPELMYSMQGGGGNNIDYINLPLMFKFYVYRQSLSVDAGLQAGYMLSNNWSYSSNKFDADICVGVSYRITENFDATFRVCIGMTKIYENYTNENSVGQLGVGYRF